jgi:hypothetical protein
LLQKYYTGGGILSLEFKFIIKYKAIADLKPEMRVTVACAGQGSSYVWGKSESYAMKKPLRQNRTGCRNAGCSRTTKSRRPQAKSTALDAKSSLWRGRSEQLPGGDSGLRVVR